MTPTWSLPAVGEVVPWPVRGPGEPLWIVRSLAVEHDWVRVRLEHLLDQEFRLSLIVPLWQPEAV